MSTGSVTHPRLPPRRGGGAGTWWSKAVVRAVEEAAFGEKDLRAGRTLARSGAVGSITVTAGGAVAAVTDGQDAYTVEVSVPVLDDGDAAAVTELVAAESGRIGALLAGQLPHSFVEAVEEAGVELLPYGGELGSACTCEAWLDPCPHALAVLTQLAWLIQVDPFVLTHLRGLSRDRVLRDLHALTRPAPDLRPDDDGQDEETLDDLAVAEDAAVRAARLLGREDPFSDW
ncbi:putative Zn finger protein [Nocardioides cavernae]|uniref:Putative Zn finger protein n=1 Tax=Nocardioides cavernae TaxID=1921566 RepID=A0A7Y9H1J8_9ACTN|nr:SWIM zinc finger family protein [Nocardioides cavernae]NYE36275.1 putative Zn finger protein [Nocardioides cavernae]